MLISFYMYTHTDIFTSQLQVTALHLASIEGHTTTVQLLLEAKADVDARDDVSKLLCFT